MRAFDHNRKYPFIITGFCYCKNPRKLNRHLYKLLQRIHRKGIYPSDLKEIKFYPTPALRKLGYSKNEIDSWSNHYPAIRSEVMRIILDYSDGVFAGIQDKTAIHGSAWTSEQLGNHVFKESLLRYILPNLNCTTDVSVIYDRGRLSPKSARAFNLDMRSSMGLGAGVRGGADVHIFHDVDSREIPGIWASDFVAGAFHQAVRYGDRTYQDGLMTKFIGAGYIEF